MRNKKPDAIYHIDDFEQIGPYRVIPNHIKTSQIMKNKLTKPTTSKRTNAPCKLEERINAINSYATALNKWISNLANEQEIINHRSKIGLWIAIVAFVVSVGHAVLALTH